MSKREMLFAALLAVAAVLIVIGVAGFDARVAWLTGGALLAGWSLFVFGNIGGEA